MHVLILQTSNCFPAYRTYIDLLRRVVIKFLLNAFQKQKLHFPPIHSRLIGPADQIGKSDPFSKHHQALISLNCRGRVV